MIRSVSADGIQIGEALYDRTIGLTTDTVFESWSNKSVAELDEDDFCTLLDTNPEVIVLGTGGASISRRANWFLQWPAAGSVLSSWIPQPRPGPITCWLAKAGR
jgi:hypothetical protein